MPEDVGERLLHDPVGGDVDADGQRPRLSLHRQLNRQPGGADLLREHVELCEARLRRLARRLARAQNGEEAAHLGEAVAADRLDSLHRHPGLLRVDPEHLLRRLRLDDHDAHRVRDGVVQLPRDPPLLVRDRLASPLFSLGLGSYGTLPQLGDVEAPRAEIHPRHPWEQDEQEEERHRPEGIADVLVRRVERLFHGEEDDEPDHAAHRDAPRAMGADGVDGDGEREHLAEALRGSVEDGRNELGGHDHEKDAHGVAPPRDEGQRGDKV